MTPDQFATELADLRRSFEATMPNVSCFDTTGTNSSVSCVFCKDCRACFNCRYSISCETSFDLTHCTRCRNCYSCTNCHECEHCVRSNYLLYCVQCFECDYCFGCVGLVKKEFHILNKKYSRGDYFRLVKQLRAGLGLPTDKSA